MPKIILHLIDRKILKFLLNYMRLPGNMDEGFYHSATAWFKKFSS